MFIQAGAVDPEKLNVEISNADLTGEPLDLSTVTAGEFAVIKPSGQRIIWPATIVSQDTDKLVLQRIFQPNDVALAGSYQISANMTTPGGVRRAGPSAFDVRY